MNIRTGLVVLATLFLMACQSGPNVPSENVGNFEQIIENERKKLGLGPLNPNRRLSAAARAHAIDMVAQDYFSHTGPNGLQFSDRAQAVGYRCVAAENIAAGQRTADQVMRAWMNSSQHRRNVLLIGARDYGIGRAQDTWVLMLGRGC